MWKEVLEKFSEENDLSNYEKMLVSTNKTTYSIDGKVVYTLHECLNSLKDDSINIIYSFLKCVDKNKFMECNDKRVLLEEMIPLYFKERLENNMYSSEFEILELALKNKELKKYNRILLGYGIMYYFSSKDIYIIPKELIDIYKEYKKTNKKHELDLQKVEKILLDYIGINAIVPIDFIEDVILNKYHLDVSLEEIKEVVKKLKLETYKNKYYAYNIKELKKIMELLLKEKPKSEYAIYTEEELHDYVLFLKKLIKDLSKYLNNNIFLAIQILSFVSMFYEGGFILIEDTLKDNKIAPNNKNKVIKIIRDNIKDIKLYICNGKSANDTLKEAVFKGSRLKERPKELFLFNILSNLVDKEKFYKDYKVNDIVGLNREIIRDVEKNIKKLNKVDLVNFLSKNDCLVEDTKGMNPELYKYMFFYESSEGLKIVIPIEFQDMAYRILSGEVRKVGRNEPCPCGSGKKYKHCCGR